MNAGVSQFAATALFLGAVMRCTDSDSPGIVTDGVRLASKSKSKSKPKSKSKSKSSSYLPQML